MKILENDNINNLFKVKLLITYNLSLDKEWLKFSKGCGDLNIHVSTRKFLNMRYKVTESKKLLENLFALS